MAFVQRGLFGEWTPPRGVWQGTTTVVTGLRRLAAADEAVVRRAVEHALSQGTPLELRFGGHGGAETLALIFAREWISGMALSPGPVLRVVVPGRIRELPAVMRAAVECAADAVDELCLPLHALESHEHHRRALLDGATAVVAFLDDAQRGGAYRLAAAAARAGIDVDVVRVLPATALRPRRVLSDIM